jgi:hypothetical protein
MLLTIIICVPRINNTAVFSWKSSPISFISRTDSAAIHWHSVESICLFPNCCISSYLALVFVLTTSKHNKNLIYPCHFNLFYRIVGSHQILGCVYNVTVSVINLFSLISVRICILYSIYKIVVGLKNRKPHFLSHHIRSTSLHKFDKGQSNTVSATLLISDFVNWIHEFENHTEQYCTCTINQFVIDLIFGV